MAEVADWSVLYIEGVDKVIERAARKCYDVRSHTTEYEDLAQEARIMVATTADLIEVIDKPEPSLGLLHERLYRDLLNLTARDDRYLGNRLSYEKLIEDFQE